MKKLSVLFIVSLLFVSAFAFGNYQKPFSSSAKIELQVRVLTVMNRLNVTSAQASQLALALIDFEKEIQPLEKQRIEELLKLRDALVTSNVQAIDEARKALERNAQGYEKAIGKLKDAFEGVITLKQAKLFREGMRSFTTANGLFSEFFRFMRTDSKPIVRPPLAPRGSKGDKEIKKEPHHQMRPFAKEDMIDALVNSQIYNIVIQTLQMKASAK